uniref:Calcium channel, voltage-dependent, alpha 2/delta subunit 4a n=1 Tax=Xiphophorus maculatus TaxID=8083 RepID=A0A3B5PYT3_XIPMA
YVSNKNPVTFTLNVIFFLSLQSFYALASTFKWFLSNVLLFLLEFNFCSFWHSEHFADAYVPKKKWNILQPCDTEYPSFIYEPSVKETNSIIKCGRCQKMFVVQQIPESNLLMLVVQGDCDCSRQYPPITLEPKEVKYNASVKCDRMRSQKIRRRPESCHSYHPQVRFLTVEQVLLHNITCRVSYHST